LPVETTFSPFMVIAEFVALAATIMLRFVFVPVSVYVSPAPVRVSVRVVPLKVQGAVPAALLASAVRVLILIAAVAAGIFNGVAVSKPNSITAERSNDITRFCLLFIILSSKF